MHSFGTCMYLITLPAYVALAQNPEAASVVSISICAASGAVAGSCPNGAMDTAQVVLAPGGGPVNSYGGLDTLADEHSTILPPGTLPGHTDYLFFVAARTNLNTSSSGLGLGPREKVLKTIFM